MTNINLSSFLGGIFEEEYLKISDIAEKSILRNKHVLQGIIRRILVDYFSIFSNENFGDPKIFSIVIPENYNYKPRDVFSIRPGEKVEVCLLPILNGNTQQCLEFFKNIRSDFFGEEGLCLLRLIPEKEIPTGRILCFPQKIEEMKRDIDNDHMIPTLNSKTGVIKESWIPYEGVGFSRHDTPVKFLAVFFRRYR